MNINLNKAFDLLDDAVSINNILRRFDVEGVPENENERKIQIYFLKKLEKLRDSIMAVAIVEYNYQIQPHPKNNQGQDE